MPMSLKFFQTRSEFKTVFAFFAFAFAAFQLNAQSPEFRGVWVDAWGRGFFDSSQVTKLVNDCHTYNFNAVVVQMRRRGDAFYFPQAPNMEPRTTALNASYDALAELIQKCHNATPRIEVHCWVTTFVIWGDRNNKPSQPGHVVNAHPEFLMENSSGEQYIGEGYYLDPGHPGATLWNYNMAKDVVSNYDVDGFHWDYIRYPTTDAGYNPTAIARYNAEFGLSGKPSPSDTQFANWRRRQVTDFVRWVNADLLQIKPNLVLSASVFGSRSDAYNARFQDWSFWNTNGYLDVCMPMGYTSDFGLFKSRCDDAKNNQGIRYVYYGQGAYMNSPAGTVNQLNYATKTNGLKGTTFYSYRTPNSGTVDQPGTFSYVRDNHQPTWVNTPALPWKTSPTNAVLKGKVVRADNSLPVYNATVNVTNTSTGTYTRTQLTEVHGTFGLFDARPGNYTIAVTTIGLGNITTNVTVTAGSVVHIDIPVPVDDTTAPTISDVSATSITDNSATIIWTTDEDSDSTVDYGETEDYDLTESNGFLTKGHSIVLTDLEPDTEYNFQVTSADASGNDSSSTNYTFRTNPEGIVNDLIIDNPSASFTGSWTGPATFSTDRYGADYRYKSKGAGSASATFRPFILTPGLYDVFEWHPEGSNRVEDAPHTVVHAEGEETFYIDQRVDGGDWNYLGTFKFEAGLGGYVRISDNATAGTVIMADAIKFSYVPYPPDAPSDLQAVGISSSEINLTWTDNSTNEVEFILFRSTEPFGLFEEVAYIPADTTNYTDTDLVEATQYYYEMIAWNAGGESEISNPANATTAAGPPVIVTQPLGLTVGEGDDATFSVTVRAKNPTFQWRFNDVVIPGATTSTLTRTNVSYIDDGEYLVIVGNDFVNTFGFVTSDVVRLRLNFQINVTTTPGGTVVRDPKNTSFGFNDTAAVSAVPTNGVFIGWSGDIVSTSPTLNLTMDHTYHLTANFMPTNEIIVDDPEASLTGNWTVNVGTVDKFGVSFAYAATTIGSATAEAVFRPNIIFPGLYNIYVWHPAATNRTTQAPIFISHQGGSINTVIDQTTAGGQWNQIASMRPFLAGTNGYALLANDTGENNKVLAADAFRFVLVNPPSIIVGPQSLNVNAGETATFGVMASGTQLAYQWRKGGTNIAGATDSTYTKPNAALADAGNYDVVLSNQTGSYPSASATLNVIFPRPQLGPVGRLPDRRFHFTQTGAPGTYIIEGSTNLTLWNPVTNLSTTNGVLQFIDNSSTNLQRRFYRSRVAP